MPPAFPGERQRQVATTSLAPLSPPGSDDRRYLQVGAFGDAGAAQRLARQMREITSLPVFIQEVVNDSRQRLHRVRVGPIVDSDEIRNITERVVAANLGSPYTVTE